MNVLRTIQKDEDEAWVNLLFEKGPHTGDNVPGYPPSFPFKGMTRQCNIGDLFYLIYKANVIGYSTIAEITEHAGSEVGTEDQPVSKGGMIILEGPLKLMDFKVRCTGFSGVRYTVENLHELEPDEAREAVNQALQGNHGHN